MKTTKKPRPNPLRRILDAVLQFAEDYAEIRQVQRQLTENAFLLGIAIGRRSILTSAERAAYARTFDTAQVIAFHELMRPINSHYARHNQEVLADAVTDWLRIEPEFRKALEHNLECSVDHLIGPPQMPTALRRSLVALLRAVAASSPGLISDDEIRAIGDKLDHPLDRP